MVFSWQRCFSFKWPTDVRKAKSVVRTLFANHCDWADVLIVRGRCFRSHKSYFKATRVLENLLWDWSRLKRPYVVYQEGKVAYHSQDPVPQWLLMDQILDSICQCKLTGPHPQGWRRPGKLYSNFMDDLGQSYEEPCRCKVSNWQYPDGCTRNTMNSRIATSLCWIAMNALRDAPPSVPPRGEPLVSQPVFGKPSWERALIRSSRRLHREKSWWKEEWHEEGGESEGCCEHDEEESAEEECSELGSE